MPGTDLLTLCSPLWADSSLEAPYSGDVAAARWGDLPRGFWDQASVPCKAEKVPFSITAHKQTAHCPPVSPGLWESTLKPYPDIHPVASRRNPAPILGRVLSRVVLKGREEGEGMPRARQASPRY